jgi:IclR family transcriptional regulator, pca regulon regulatory protein
MRAAKQTAVSRDRNHVTALVRGLSVIRAFTNQTENLTLSDISRLVDLPRATTRRCLLTLESQGYVESDRNFFRIAPQVLALANAYLTSSSLLRICQPFIERISHDIDESVSVSVLDRGAIIYVARSAKRRMESLHRNVGSQLPAYCTSMGRVLLAHQKESDLDRYLKLTTLVQHTPRTIADATELRRVLAEVRRQDFCLLDQEFDWDLRSLAIPLRNASDQVVAAINIGSQASKVSKRTMVKSYLPVLRRAAAEMRPLLI